MSEPVDQMPTVLKELAEMTKDFRSLYKSVRLSCAAVLRDGSWYNLGTRLELRDTLPIQVPLLVRPTDDFFASVVDIPYVQFAQVAYSIIALKTTPQDWFVNLTNGEILDAKLEFQDPAAGQAPREIRFGTPYTYPKASGALNFGVNHNCVAIQGNGENLETIAGHGFIPRLEPKLRFGTTFENMADLIRHFMPGMRIQQDTQVGTVIVAPIPFALLSSEDPDVTRVVVHASTHADPADLKLKMFFKPSGVVVEGSFSEAEKTDLGFIFTPKWPTGSKKVRCLLYYKEHEVDEVDVGRWPGTFEMRVALNSYFDAGHARLLEGLEARENEGKEGPDFELAIVRLLHILGLPITWYGVRTKSRRPDAAGYIELNGRRIVLLCECTLISPQNKLSALKDRAEQLSSHLEKEVEVAPLLFCAANPVESDYLRAIEHGITLIGKNEISQLSSQLRATVDAEKGLQLFNQFRQSVLFRAMHKARAH